MKTVYKYPLEVEDEQTLVLPKGAQILSLQVQAGTPCIWALVDPKESHEEWTFRTFGTGFKIPEGLELTYISTYQLGALVFHVFESNPSK